MIRLLSCLSVCLILGSAAGKADALTFAGDWDLNSSVSGHVTEIIVQTKVRHLPVILAGDRDAAAAKERAKGFMEVGHPVYLLDSCREEDILALARQLKKKYDLKPKLEVTGPACVPAAAIYQKYQRKEELFTWVHAENPPDGFTSEDLIHMPTQVRASRAFARRFVHPVSIAKNEAGNWLVDFGRAAFGWVEAKTPAAVDAVAGEKLTDGKSVDVIPFSAIRSARAKAAATDGAAFKRLVFKTEIYSRGRCLSVPRELGEVMPMRYLEIPANAFEPTQANVRMVALEYPFDETESGFFSDSRALDAVYDLCKYTLRACTFGGLYIDGDRERLPYEADAYVTQLSNYAMTSDYEVSRVTCDYLMPYPTWPTEYRQISVLMAWSYWMWSGRDDLLKKHYAQLKDEKLMERFRRDSDGLLETGGEMFHGAYEGASDIVDWPPPERFGFEFRKANAVVNAYYYIGLNEMAEIATRLGRTADAQAFRARAARVYDSFQKAFFDPERGIYVDGQGATHASIHANALAVVAGLVPAEKVKGVGDWLAGREMECSVYFAQHFLEALFKTGHGARAVALMTADNDRSWVGMIKAGATMTKESWNEGVKANIDWNHTWGAAAINVIARCLAGVTPAKPGFERIRIAPDPAGLGTFNAKVPTAKGPVTVRYARTGVKEHLVVTTPAPATIVFRGETREVAAGTHTFGSGKDLEAFGVAYYPEAWDEARWPRDLALMKELGVGMVRVGEFNWGRFEPTEGDFDFAQYKRFLKLCAEQGMDVLMCTPTAASPKWMAADYPDTEKTLIGGVKPKNGIRQTSCQTSKRFHKFSRRIVEKMAEAFRDEPAVVAWQLDNELSLTAATGECVCEECQEGFREYLKGLYGSLENLNRCWNGVFWSADFHDWDEILLPINVLHRHGWQYDYNRFRSLGMERQMADQAAILRKHNPAWRITTNNPGFGEGQRLDLVFRDLGYASTDRYPNAKPEEVALIRWMYGVFRAVTGNERHFMIGETGTWGTSADRADSYALMRSWYWDAILHGAESYFYFRWRMSVAGEETHPAVLPWSGEPGFTFDVLKKNRAEAESFGEPIARTPEPESPIALLYDPEASDMHRMDQNRYGGMQRGHTAFYNGFLAYGYLPRIVMKRPGEVDLAGVKVLVLPYVEVVDEPLMAKLRDFTANGGVLVSSIRLNCFEPLGHNYVNEISPRGLRDVFGLDVGEWYGLSEGKVDFPGGVYSYRDAIEYLKPHPGCEVPVRLSSSAFKGAPLLTCNRYGNGFAYYLAAPPDEEGAAVFAKWLLERHGYDASRRWPLAVTRLVRGRYAVVNNLSDQELEIPSEDGRLICGKPVVRDGKTFIRPWDLLVYDRTPSPTLAAPRTDWAGGQFFTNFTGYVKTLDGRELDLVVVGDSITMGWTYPAADEGWPGGKEVWAKHYGQIATANLGVSGDRTEHVLWRIVKAGQTDKWKAKTIVLMIGINNHGQIRPGATRSDTPEEAFAGARAIVEQLKAKHPESRLVVLGALPWPSPNDGLAWVRAYNGLLKGLDDGRQVIFRDIGSAFLDSENEQKRALFRDGLHPNPEGYEVFATELDEVLGF